MKGRQVPLAPLGRGATKVILASQVRQVLSAQQVQQVLKGLRGFRDLRELGDLRGLKAIQGLHLKDEPASVGALVSPTPHAPLQRGSFAGRI